MVTLRMLSLGVALFAALFAPLRCQAAAETASVANLTIAVADFSGSDKEVGRFVADTLLTDLAQSGRLQLVERSEIGRALTELKLQSTGLTEPKDVQKVGKLIGADRLIVGSYLIRDNQLIINARLLDLHTGRVMAGGAANVTGPRDALLPLVHRLAHLFHKRVTGEDFALDGEMDAQPANLNDNASHASPPSGDGDSRNGSDPPADTRHIALTGDPPDSAPPPAANGGDINLLLNGPPDTLVTEREMAAVTRQIGGGSGSTFFTMQRAGAPVTRIRALAALVKASFPLTGQPSLRVASFSGLVPDFDTVPIWGRPFLSAAIAHGMWSAHHAFRATEYATRGFVHVLIGRMPRRRAIPAIVARARRDVEQRHVPVAELASQSEVSQLPEPSGYTGLVVDARDLPLDRSMSLRVLDEDGRLIYPDADHMPTPDYVDDNGTAAYNHTIRDVTRAGGNPLLVQALRISGDDVIVSRDTADQILAENRHAHFLWAYRVSILVDEGR